MIQVKPGFLLGIRPGTSCSAFLSDCIQLCFLQRSTKFLGPGSFGMYVRLCVSVKCFDVECKGPVHGTVSL